MPARRKPIDPGSTFGAWTVVENVRRGRQSYCLCVCACGTRKEVRRDALLRGDSTGCHACANRGGRNLRHGENRRGDRSPEYISWLGMHHRCSPGYKRPQDYFERGIVVCEEWSGDGGYERFLSHVGRRPGSGYSLDRIDNDRGYEPGNVRWATATMQANNRRSGGGSRAA